MHCSGQVCFLPVIDSFSLVLWSGLAAGLEEAEGARAEAHGRPDGSKQRASQNEGSPSQGWGQTPEVPLNGRIQLLRKSKSFSWRNIAEERFPQRSQRYISWSWCVSEDVTSAALGSGKSCRFEHLRWKCVTDMSPLGNDVQENHTVIHKDQRVGWDLRDKKLMTVLTVLQPLWNYFWCVDNSFTADTLFLQISKFVGV